MKPLEQLQRRQVENLEGIVFDLDGTVLDDGALSLGAYQALHGLRQAGLSPVLCTGRSAAWGQALQRQWPLEVAVTENGAIAFSDDGRIERLAAGGAASAEEGGERARLLAIVAELRAAFPQVPEADDNLGRLSDVTFDIGEHHSASPEVIAAMRKEAARLGARTFASSIHLHVTLARDDKASGTIHALRSHRRDLDPSALLARYAFVGDSANDAACFAAFRLTFAVANVRPHLGAFARSPLFMSHASAGAGFVEIADRLSTLRP